MNPEFQRNLYLEVSFARILGMPLSLMILFAFTYAMSEHKAGENIADMAMWLYVFIVVFWGSRQAAESIFDELRNRTWDIQKTSAISPWSLAWGKLFGSTLFNWYGGILCLTVYVLGTPKTESIGLIVLCAISGGLLAQTLSLLVSLLALRKKQLLNSSMSYLFVLFLLFFVLAMVNGIDDNATELLHWFSFKINLLRFGVGSLIFANVWSIVGVYRLLCQELQIRTLPWVWLGFMAFWIVYLQGLIIGHSYDRYASMQEDIPFVSVLMLITFGLAATLTYGLLLMDSNSPMLPRRLWLYAQQENWPRFLEELPCWFISLIIALPACLYLSVFFTDPSTEKLHFYPIPAFLLMVRDIALILFLNYAQNPKRALSLTLLYLTFLYWIIPVIFVEANATFLAGLFLPLFYDNLGLAIVVASVQAGLMGYLLFQRWQKTLHPSFSNTW